jgi:hypothetical protein
MMPANRIGGTSFSISCAAVLNFPKPGSAEYFAAIKESDSNHFIIRHIKRFGRAWVGLSESTVFVDCPKFCQRH